jgi:hypothetical protein
MDAGSGTNWRDILWSLLKPALVAAIVALLVVLGVTGLRPPVGPGGGGAGSLGIMSGTHYSGPLIVAGGIETGNNLTMSNGSLINSKGGITVTDNLVMQGGYIMDATGAVTVNDGLAVYGNVAGTGAYLRLNSNTLMTGSLYMDGELRVNGAIFDNGAGLRLDDNTTVTGTLSSTGAVAVGTWLRGVAQSGIVVTGWITPTGSFQPISAAAWVTPTLNVSAGASGDMLMLVNTGTPSICLVDTGSVVLSADWTAGQYDTLLLYHDGSRWLELARANN